MMEPVTLKQIIDCVCASHAPTIEPVKTAQNSGPRLGVFASSFNPVTTAHVELMRRAAEQFSLDQMMALAGCANADKTSYECSLEDRLKMLAATFATDERVSVALSSHAYFVDLVEAKRKVCPLETDLHFIIGFDTFERVLDREGRYFQRYHISFKDRLDALGYLLERSRLVVAARAGAGARDFERLLGGESREIRDRIIYMDFPSDLGERSATEVREKLRAGDSIAGLVPHAVERYIKEQDLYR